MEGKSPVKTEMAKWRRLLATISHKVMNTLAELTSQSCGNIQPTVGLPR